MNSATRISALGTVSFMCAERTRSMFCTASRSGRTRSSKKTLRQQKHGSSACSKPNVRKRGMPNKRSEENEYRVTGSVLDELGLDRQAALELKLKAALHQNILQLVKRRGHGARDLERILQLQHPPLTDLIR